MKVIIAPFSAKLRTVPVNPKNYPVRFWAQVLTRLTALDIDVIQIGVTGEPRLQGVTQFVTNWPLDKLVELMRRCDTFISVDSFFPHLCHLHGLKSGVVIWGQSDPLIFGHPENTNLLKDRKHLRALQFQHWEDVVYDESVFVLPDEVVNAVLAKLAIASVVTA